MRLAQALAFCQKMNAKGEAKGRSYSVMRSGKRSPGVSPFYVKLNRR